MRDASGNILSIFTEYPDGSKMYQSEYNIYGSARLGTINTNTLVYPRPVNQTPGNFHGCCAEARSLTAMNPERSISEASGSLSTISDLKTPLNSNANNITEGFAAVIVNQQSYYPFGMFYGCFAEARSLTAMNPERSISEASGALSTISDLTTPLNSNANNITEGFAAVVINQQSYYPFGMFYGCCAEARSLTAMNPERSISEASGIMPEMQYSLNSNESGRFGFNGKENDDEVKGASNSIDFGARCYNSRLGVWLSVDPFQTKYPYLSPYNFVANSPIIAIDPNGKEIYIVTANGQFYQAAETLLKTPDGKVLYEKYAKNKTDDIYITVVKFPEGDVAAAFTLSNMENHVGASSVNTSILPEDRRQIIKNGFNNKDVDFSKSKGKAIHLIAVDENYLTNPSTDKYEAAEVLYHEAKAHIDGKGGTESDEHNRYGSSYAGLKKENPVYDGYGDRLQLPGVKGYVVERVPTGSPADRIIDQLLELKRKEVKEIKQ